MCRQRGAHLFTFMSRMGSHNASLRYVAAAATQMSAYVNWEPRPSDETIMTPGHARPHRRNPPARTKPVPHLR